jgi:hypothetical protein
MTILRNQLCLTIKIKISILNGLLTDNRKNGRSLKNRLRPSRLSQPYTFEEGGKWLMQTKLPCTQVHDHEDNNT